MQYVVTDLTYTIPDQTHIHTSYFEKTILDMCSKYKLSVITPVQSGINISDYYLLGKTKNIPFGHQDLHVIHSSSRQIIDKNAEFPYNSVLHTSSTHNCINQMINRGFTYNHFYTDQVQATLMTAVDHLTTLDGFTSSVLTGTSVDFNSNLNTIFKMRDHILSTIHAYADYIVGGYIQYELIVDNESYNSNTGIKCHDLELFENAVATLYEDITFILESYANMALGDCIQMLEFMIFNSEAYSLIPNEIVPNRGCINSQNLFQVISKTITSILNSATILLSVKVLHPQYQETVGKLSYVDCVLASNNGVLPREFISSLMYTGSIQLVDSCIDNFLYGILQNNKHILLHSSYTSEELESMIKRSLHITGVYADVNTILDSKETIAGTFAAIAFHTAMLGDEVELQWNLTSTGGFTNLIFSISSIFIQNNVQLCNSNPPQSTMWSLSNYFGLIVYSTVQAITSISLLTIHGLGVYSFYNGDQLVLTYIVDLTIFGICNILN